MAWINATPNGEGHKPRIEFFESQNLAAEMPECDADYILTYLFELGISIGDQALTHSEIQNWQLNTGVELNAFEARTLKKLSENYLSESHKAKAEDAETPWIDAPRYMSVSYFKSMKAKAALRKAAEI